MNYLEDSNGNKSYIDHFGSVEEAQDALDSLGNCTGCINCASCSFCTNCTSCSFCTDCLNLEGCFNFVIGSSKVQAVRELKLEPTKDLSNGYTKYFK